MIPVDDGIWEWHGPESVIAELVPSASYTITGPTESQTTVSEVGTPTFIPVVNDTDTLADDFDLVGKPIKVGYRIFGDHVLRQGTVVFSVTGPGEIAGAVEVSFSTDENDEAYVTTTMVATDITPNRGDLQTGGVLEQNDTVPLNRPAPKELDTANQAGVRVFLWSEDELRNADGTRAFNRVRGKHTPKQMTADRITIRVDTNEFLYVVGDLPPGAKLAFVVDNQGSTHGTLKAVRAGGALVDVTQPVEAPALAANGDPNVKAATLVIRGMTQTAGPGPGQADGVNAGKLILRVVDANNPAKELVKSAGFSVAAIPIGVKAEKLDDLNAAVFANPKFGMPGEPKYLVQFGARYKVTFVSDSGVQGDLDQVEFSEIIQNPVGTDALAGFRQDSSSYAPIVNTNGFNVDVVALTRGINEATADQAKQAGIHDFMSLGFDILSTPPKNLGGAASNEQYHIFKDKRTGSADIVMANSAFKHELSLTPNELDGGQPKRTFKISKIAKKLTVKGTTTVVEAGEGGGTTEMVVRE